MIYKIVTNIFLCLMLCLSAQSVNSNVTDKSDKTFNKTSSRKTETDLLTQTKLSLLSEGGSLLANTPDLSLPNQKSNTLFSLDDEGIRNKKTGSVPRKGAPDPTEINTDSKTLKPKTVTAKVSTSEKPDVLKGLPSLSVSESNINSSGTIINENTSAKPSSTFSPVPKKPLILSSEAIANMEKNLKSEGKIPVVPSTKTIDSSQIPSPNEESIVKVYPTKANSHPDMIMPIVISILVVPMFVIVGYMVLKRGKEAWKNRHYKRMDFLLDGMYND